MLGEKKRDLQAKGCVCYYRQAWARFNFHCLELWSIGDWPDWSQLQLWQAPSPVLLVVDPFWFLIWISYIELVVTCFQQVCLILKVLDHSTHFDRDFWLNLHVLLNQMSLYKYIHWFAPSPIHCFDDFTSSFIDHFDHSLLTN